MSTRLRAALAWLSLAVGIGYLGAAAYIPAKAWLAQLLLQSAWNESSVDGNRARPWPWADTFPVARLHYPRAAVEQIVLAGASGRVLAFGPGHVSGTAQPGGHGNVVISAHRDTHFRWLRDVRPGQWLELEVPGGRRDAYRVTTTAVHHERDTWLLDPAAGDRLTLVTCFPFDAVEAGTPWRFVVSAARAAVP